jgi:hypothetical protein
MRIAMIACLAVVPLAGQEIKIPASFDALAAKATQVVDVTMDSSMLQLASRFLSDIDPDEAKAKKLVTGLKGVYVKSFEFDKTGEYQESDVEAIRAQLRAPGWSRIVGVRSRKDGNNAEVFIRSAGDQIAGLAVVVAEPKELTIVNIVGSIRPEDLRDLGGNFGIPKLDVGGAATRKSNPAKED